MHPDAAAFLAAIIDRPDDDLPRMIYADWLDEHGEGERAEFIRVQCELARLPDPHGYGDAVIREPAFAGGSPCDCHYCVLRRRGGELLDAHGREWSGDNLRAGLTRVVRRSDGAVIIADADRLPIRFRRQDGPDELGEAYSPYAFRRGFVESVTLAAADWLAHADALTAATPLREVTLTTWPEITFRGNEHRYHLYQFRDHYAEVPFRLPAEPHTYDHYLRLLNAEWPRIRFTLPQRGFAPPAARPVH